MLDGDVWVGPTRDFLHRPFDEPQIDEFNKGQGFPLRWEAVEGVTFAAYN